MGLELIIPPATEPVSLVDMKAHLRITTSDEDDFIEGLIKVARSVCEKHQGRSYITQTWDLWLDNWPEMPLEIPKAPLQEITHIKYYDTSNTEYPWATTEYFVDSKSFVGRVDYAYGKSAPSVSLRPLNAVVIRFVSGYESPETGDETAGVPREVKHAIKLLTAHLFENRENTVERKLEEIPFGIKALLGLDRVINT